MDLSIANYGTVAFDGWLRTTTDFWLGADDAAPVVVLLEDTKVLAVPGPEVGPGCRIVDLRVSGLGRSTSWSGRACATFGAAWQAPAIDENWIMRIGEPEVGGKPMELRRCAREGAAVALHWQVQVQTMLWCDLWVWGFDEMPGILFGELAFTASQAGVPDTTVMVARECKLTYGNEVITSKLYPGMRIADGQVRAWPIRHVFPKLLHERDKNAAYLHSQNAVGAVALRSLYPEMGWPKFTAPAMQYVNQHLLGCISALDDWSKPTLGVAKTSGDTGAQEDQLFPGGEAYRLPNGIMPRYYAALSQGKRPVHHLESNGYYLAPSMHPRLVMWDSRAHYHTGVSPDQLGKVRALAKSETEGWWGPDEEHWLHGSIFASSRLTASPVLQKYLTHMAINWILQKTVDPKVSTSRPGAARAVGYEGYAAYQLWWGLRDRSLAEDVYRRWQARVTQVILPKLKPKGDIWDIRKDDPRLGTGEWWMPWQQGLGAWGLYIGAELLRHEEAMEFAVAAAWRVFRSAYYKSEDHIWKAHYALSLDGRVKDANYADFGCPLALAVLMRESETGRLMAPDFDLVKSAWEDHLLRGSGRWTDPGLVQRSH